jgi:hypothetical protein
MKWLEKNGFPAVVLTQSDCRALNHFRRRQAFEPHELAMRCFAFSPSTRQVMTGDRPRATICTEKGQHPVAEPKWEHLIQSGIIATISTVAMRGRDIMVVFDRGKDECSIGLVPERTTDWIEAGPTVCPLFAAFPFPPLHRGFDIRPETVEPMAVVQGLHLQGIAKCCAAAKVDTALLLTSGPMFPLRAVVSGTSTWDCLFMPGRDRIGQEKFARK